MVQACNSDLAAPDRFRCCQQAGSLLQPRLFRALGDPTRIGVLLRLTELGGPATVSEIAGCCPVDLSVVSRHLATLRQAGVVAAEKRGRAVRYRVLYASLARTLRELAAAIEACCPRDDLTPAGPIQDHPTRKELSP
jgi:DNA-binding transcriptional ArsR family regulator